MKNLSGFAKAHIGVLIAGIVGLPLLFFFAGTVAFTVGATYWLSAWSVLVIFHVVFTIVKNIGNKQKNNF